MKSLITILFTVIIVSSLSGCVVDAHYGYRHRHGTGVIVTNVPPPPPPAVVVRPVPPPPPPMVIVKSPPPPPTVIVRPVPAPPHHRGNPAPKGRRDLRR